MLNFEPSVPQLSVTMNIGKGIKYSTRDWSMIVCLRDKSKASSIQA